MDSYRSAQLIFYNLSGQMLQLQDGQSTNIIDPNQYLMLDTCVDCVFKVSGKKGVISFIKIDRAKKEVKFTGKVPCSTSFEVNACLSRAINIASTCTKILSFRCKNKLQKE